MERLMNALANNCWAKDEVKLVHVTAMTWQDAQYENAKILADYAEYANYTIAELKERYLLHK
jgi:hypothetical protein